MNRLADPYFRLNNLYKITDKNFKEITFVMNDSQKKYYKIKNKYKKTKTLKARQIGITTLEILIALDKSLWLPNQNLVITAHEKDKQKEIFKRVKYAYDKLPSKILCDGKYLLKPTAKYDNVNELYFDDINSSIKVALDSRSGTVSSLHITELAFRRDAKEMMAGTMPSLPQGAYVSIETTANGQVGVGKYFYDFYNADNGFYPLFFPWYDHYEYQTQCPKGFKFPQQVEQYRKWLDNYTKEQQDNKLYWYYNGWRQLGEDMAQENPTYPEEAFLTTGTNVFDNKKLQELQDLDIYYDVDEKVPGLKIFNKSDECYVAIDTAGGGEKGDFTSIIGRDKHYGLLFHYYERCAPEDAMRVIQRIEELGYRGMFIPELNATTGGQFIELLKAQDLKNFTIYRRGRGTDDIKGSTLKRYGFLTTVKTRNEILDHYEQIVREGILDEFSKDLLQEMKFFYISESGKREASPGQHDDAIMSDAIGCYIIGHEDIQLAQNIDASKIKQALLR